ncbi:hypothetical protein TSUD_280990 [Trifolium subterraneum]|uniref:Uncharacterized protein n=1 Tax=Trifolium subterraneum TaxID=3900 RepID=A0A2Z6NTY0_TRISU|nr:hypothetical protein TSUD_280990 [Trifolium subterraneum]
MRVATPTVWKKPLVKTPRSHNGLLCVDIMIDRSVWKVDGDWNKLWVSHIPPKRSNEAQLDTFVMRAWSLWRKRNMQLWENTIDTVQHVVVCANQTLQAWRHANSTAVHRPASVPQHRQQQVRWQPTPPTIFKCNIDETVYTHDNKDSLGTMKFLSIHCPSLY